MNLKQVELETTLPKSFSETCITWKLSPDKEHSKRKLHIDIPYDHRHKNI